MRRPAQVIAAIILDHDVVPAMRDAVAALPVRIPDDHFLLYHVLMMRPFVVEILGLGESGRRGEERERDGRENETFHGRFLSVMTPSF
jgi:hypothetical protein